MIAREIYCNQPAKMVMTGKSSRATKISIHGINKYDFWCATHSQVAYKKGKLANYFLWCDTRT